MVDYDEQLGRALDETPGIAAGGERFAVPDPVVRTEGNVTVYENFQETVDRLDREESLVLRYLQTDLGTSAGIDERGRARLTGSFDADRIGEAIEDFADAYVRCPECGLPDTRLVEQNGAEMIRCDACGALSPAG
ncbi:MAG TPA: translation initiation factor IF-2 subunit beta [Halobacteriales archaeon]|nr:translation initiation factor IF-2 subunit beta [Halobacteriales archaeon]